MLPRRSSVFRYFVFILVSVVVLVFWMTGPAADDRPSSSWNWMLSTNWFGNETELQQEVMRLHSLLNVSMTTENMSLSDLQQHLDDLKRMVPVNPHWFRYVINPTDVCIGKDIFLLVYVHSAPSHFKQRMVIRETWGNPKNFPDSVIKVVFLCGIVPERLIQDALLMEADVYGDIIQEDFIDSYRNLTFKGIMGLKWTSTYCKQAKFLLKTDDDIFVNMFNLIAHLKSMIAHRGQVKNLLLCLVWYHMKVMRDPKSKWYLSPTEFEPDYFPTYCSGSAFVLTVDVADAMFNASLQTPFFWVDDFYVTGLLANKVGVVHENFNSVYSLGPSTFLQKFTEPNRWLTLVVGHVHNLNYMKVVWKNALREHQVNSTLNQQSQKSL